MNQPQARREFESLLLPLLDFFLGLAMQLTRNRTQAEDLVQEALLRAYRAFPTFRPGSNFRAWVARILINGYLNERSRARRWAEGIDLEQVPDPSGTAPSSTKGKDVPVVRLDEIPRDAFGDEVLEALHELPGDMAVAVYLADVEEISYAEIAEVLEIPLGTVRSRIFRGRRHLEKRLQEYARGLGMTREGPS